MMFCAVVLAIALIVELMFVLAMVGCLSAIFDQLEVMLKGAVRNKEVFQNWAKTLHDQTKEHYSSLNDPK